MNDLDALVKQVKQSTNYQINKKLLNEKIKTDLHVPYNQGLFLIDTNLLAFLATWPDNQLFLADIYDNPIEVDRQEFLTICRQHYQKVMNRWHIEHNELKKQRKI